MRHGCDIVIFLSVGYVFAQDYFEERHKNQVRTHLDFTDIPNRFEVKGENAVGIFKKYATNIQNLATKDNSTVTYKIKVDVTSNNIRKTITGHKKPISKKYNVPLKKKNMKLSSFEMSMRKRVSENILKQKLFSDDVIATTEVQKVMHTTKQSNGGKYKPIVHGVKTNYAKIIKPVRNKIITLTMD